ncbi:hypothetical protein [Paraliobacillus sp. JSM ZJ581]|uniref:hypothetical protein n=1 Tax=Paraliobacillus sp. JSM ZJ581 TaxID=3342118 RepID=UPI0035A86FEB
MNKRLLKVTIIFVLILSMLTPLSNAVSEEIKKGESNASDFFEMAKDGETIVENSADVKGNNGELLRVIKSKTEKK